MEKKVLNGWRRRFHEVIFEADTTAGKTFDVLLIIVILLSVIVAMLDSVRSIYANYSGFLDMAEWFFTVLFTFEYVLRLLCVGRPLMYATSFFGVVDLLGILPTYISLFFPGSHYLAVIRILRVLRVFRVLNMVKYMNEAQYLLLALKSSSRKIAVFV